jgi:hypothetical protein
MRVVRFVFMLLLTTPALCNDKVIAQEIHLLGGIIQERGSRDRSYSWIVQYSQDLGEDWAVSFSWLNEGHFAHHHRDGHAMQLWVHTNPLWKRFVLAAGIGPYRYYDTKLAMEGASYVDSHGWGAIASFSATLHLDQRWLFTVQSNFIETGCGMNTSSLTAGIGYELEPSKTFDETHPSISEVDDAIQNEIAVLGGRTIVNSRESENAISLMLEYRRSLGQYVDWTIGWLNEGRPGPIDRGGMLTELWLVRRFLDDRLSLGVGGGPYLALDRCRNPQAEGDERPAIAGLITMSASYALWSPWVVRISWHRVVTDYDRDTDVILAGLGFCF